MFSGPARLGKRSETGNSTFPDPRDRMMRSCAPRALRKRTLSGIWAHGPGHARRAAKWLACGFQICNFILLQRAQTTYATGKYAILSRDCAPPGAQTRGTITHRTHRIKTCVLRKSCVAAATKSGREFCSRRNLEAEGVCVASLRAKLQQNIANGTRCSSCHGKMMPGEAGGRLCRR